LLLFLVMDPVGNLPVFVSILETVPPQRRRRVLLRELTVAYMVLAAFLLAGKYLVRLLHVSSPALAIAGGVILFLVSLRMVFPGTRRDGPAGVEGEPFLVPLAVPLIAGPAAMTMLLIFATRHADELLRWFIALTLAWLSVCLILLLSGPIRRVLGRRGVRALERLMGMVLITLAIQMLLDGIRAFLAADGIWPEVGQTGLAG
jgi:multiple antibiotic resistance protein